MNPNTVTLTKTTTADLATLYQFQLDEEACYVAAFTNAAMQYKDAYIERYSAFLNNPTIHNQTIRVNNVIVGSIAKFVMDNEAEVTYWIDKAYWGKGIATAALQHFLTLELTRPLFGRVAFDNIASQKVLEKCGFVKIGTDKGFANARQMEVEEYIYKCV